MYIGESNGCGCNERPGLGLAPLIIPAISLVASVAPALMGKKKPPTMSSFGFHVDNFSSRILDAERQITALRNQIADTMRQPRPQYPMNPWPPAEPPPVGSGGKGLQAWFDAMRPVVAQYSSQSDCVTNKNQIAPGGCYEQTYSRQLELIEGLKRQLGNAGQVAVASQTIPNPGSAVALPYQVPTILPQPGPGYGSTIPTQTPNFLPSTAPNISITSAPGPGQAPMVQSAPGVADTLLQNWPLVLGVGALAVFLMTGKKGKA